MKSTWGAKFEFDAIGVVRTPFADKYGTPRQPGLAANALGLIKLADDPDLRTALRSLSEFSHLWIVFVFHQHGGRNWKPSIRPPRLGGNRKVGVLSSRSPHRPNPIGLSAVKIEKIDVDAAGGAEIHVSGVDLLDGTPVLDIKPYIPYADSIPNANAGWADQAIVRACLSFSMEAGATLNELRMREPGFEGLLTDILALDPRPAFQKREVSLEDPKSEGASFGIKIGEHEIKYEIGAGGFLILQILSGGHF